MVLHQKPSGGAIPTFYRREAEEAGELVVGPHRSAEEEGGANRGGALEAHTTQP